MQALVFVGEDFHDCQINQLIVTFKCDYCPKGLAGALIKYLMVNEMQSCYN